MTITGAGARTTIISGGAIDRVFEVRSGTVAISGLTITNGNPGSAGGGGLYNLGTLTLTDIAVTGSTGSNGGGIYNDGTITLTWVTLSGNTATSDGGGVYSTGAGPLNYLTNVTISGNSASGVGGGMHADRASLTNVTVVANSATSGSGLYDRGGQVFSLQNTIIANNTGSNQCAGAPASLGYNLASDASCILTGTGDKPNTNPNLGALADNGGPTNTQALLSGSLAIDAGTNTGAPATDQRGVARPQDGDGNGSAITDIGAYEYELAIKGNVFEDVNYGGGAGRDKTTSAGVSRSGARLELYNNAGFYVTFTTTDASGNYVLGGLTSGNYTVRVVNSTATSSRTGYVAGLLPVQTFRTNASSGSAVAVTDYVGGQNPAVADAGNGAAGCTMNTTTGVFTGGGCSGTAQSITNVTVGSSTVNNVDFGFNFDTIVNTNDSGQGSFRQFITNANTLGGDASLAQSGLVAAKENAVFMISNGTAAAGLRAANNYFSSGVATISPASALPTISTVMVIDAQKQPGWTNAPIIRLDGVSAGVSADGLYLADGSDDSTIRGLMITSFTHDGIVVASGADNVWIAGNWIGTSGTGSTGVGNTYDGIESFAVGTKIGGTGVNDGNVVTNSGNDGISLDGSGVTGYVIQGNIIGLDPDGASGGGNVDVGIGILNGTGNTIGGTTPAARNVISNNKEGIEINTANNTVQGNYIGTDVTRTLNRGNRSDDGIEIRNSATGNMIGGTAAGAGNVIAYNALDGVTVETGTGNAILGNSIYGNTGLGIDRGSNGVSGNNGTKDCSLANCGMDYPVFTTATISGSTLTVAGYVGSAPNQATFANATVEIFRSDNDGSGYGEGQHYLGFLTADANGNFSGNLTVIGMAPGYRITGTATDGSNNTSEFGPNRAVTTGGGRCPGFTVTTPTDSAAAGSGSLRDCITAANATTGKTVVVPAGTYTLTIAGQNEDNNATGDLDIRSGMTITGEGAKVTTIDGGGIDRVFHVVTGTVTLSGMKIQNGNPGGGNGSGILNQSTLTLNDVAVRNNFTSDSGGGIYNDTAGTLTVLRSTISGNTASGNGGGIYGNNGTIGLTNVTISGNSASNGGGLYNQSAGGTTLTNVTIASNSGASSGGGIYRNGGTVTLKNTIVANSTSGGNCSGTITSAGYNIDSGNTCAVAGVGDRLNTNPNLGALADNGGATMTHALQAGSPAIDSGTATGAPTTDQRGALRPQGTGYDIGAYEYAVPTAVKLISFTATAHEGSVHLQWKTGYEVDNLGFHIYREEDGQLYRLTPELIAGSALLAGKGTALTAGRHYAWWDTAVSVSSGQKYWLEDIDLDGTKTLHGPVSSVVSREPLPENVKPEFLADFGMKIQDRYREHARVQNFRDKIGRKPLKKAASSQDVSQSLKAPQAAVFAEAAAVIYADTSHLSFPQAPNKSGQAPRVGNPSEDKERFRTSRNDKPSGTYVVVDSAVQPTDQDRAMQRSLASGPAVKIFIEKEGWYRISQAELVATGLSQGTNARYLQLYAEGKEQPIRVIGTKHGTSFDAVEFCGTGLDTPSTDRKPIGSLPG